uniref:Uncharacterized protein n=1 Tax=Avena sativa TaxID=4498 RepID=A0ACD5Y4R0_AVESA
MAARASSLALCALLALCLGWSPSSSVSSEHGHGFPCDDVVVIRVPHSRPCDRDRCGGLCVEQYMWKYPDIMAVVGDCTGENPLFPLLTMVWPPAHSQRQMVSRCYPGSGPGICRPGQANAEIFR